MRRMSRRATRAHANLRLSIRGMAPTAPQRKRIQLRARTTRPSPRSTLTCTRSEVRGSNKLTPRTCARRGKRIEAMISRKYIGALVGLVSVLGPTTIGCSTASEEDSAASEGAMGVGNEVWTVGQPKVVAMGDQ